MADTPIFVISDLHMGDGGPRDNFAVGNRRAQLDCFLDHVATEGGELIILGDLFEFWQASVGKVFVQSRELLDRFAEMSAVYVIGNHDADLQALIDTDFLSHPFFGMMSTPFERTINGKRLKFMHGHEVDQFNSGDMPSWGRMMAIFAGICEDKIGSPMMGKSSVENLLTCLGELLLKGFKWLANRCAKRKADKTKDPKGELTPSQNPDRAKEMLQKYQEDKESIGYDVAIVGHTHEPGHIADWYFNSGSWAAATNNFLRISQHGVVEVFDWADGKAVPNETLLEGPQ